MEDGIGPVAQELTKFLEEHASTAFYGRIVKAIVGKDPEENEYFCEANQLYPFVMGPETIHELTRRNAWDMLNFIGYDRVYVMGRLREGNRYYLMLFTGYDTSDEVSEPVLATWENVLKLIDDTDAEIGSRVRAVLPIIKSTSYDAYDIDIEHIEPSLYRQVSSFAEFAKSDHTSPTMVRAFLRHALKLMRLYSGDGYTYSEHSVRGSKEYLMRRVKLSQLHNRTPFFPLWKDMEESPSQDV